jgi:hypothetical protein
MFAGCYPPIIPTDQAELLAQSERFRRSVSGYAKKIHHCQRLAKRPGVPRLAKAVGIWAKNLTFIVICNRVAALRRTPMKSRTAVWNPDKPDRLSQ